MDFVDTRSRVAGGAIGSPITPAAAATTTTQSQSSAPSPTTTTTTTSTTFTTTTASLLLITSGASYLLSSASGAVAALAAAAAASNSQHHIVTSSGVSSSSSSTINHPHEHHNHAHQTTNSNHQPTAAHQVSAAAAAQAAASAATAAAASASGLSSENGPILYNEPNRTSAIDDIRSVVLYIFIITIFFTFFLILPGIRNEKFPTFLCITTSLIVVSIILISLFGTSWHVAEAPISAAYKAFSRDRIQGELKVSIGLQSVNITLRAHKYYVLNDVQGPMIMYNINIDANEASSSSNRLDSELNSKNLDFLQEDLDISIERSDSSGKSSNLADELTIERTSDGTSIETDLELEEVFPTNSVGSDSSNRKINRRAAANNSQTLNERSSNIKSTKKRQPITSKRKFSIERLNVDINYNERFYFIEPEQMRQEHHNALQRGLPYPILTVVEYLSQDEAGFSWSRQYRAAGYYSYIMLWLSLCICGLMFILHCAAPKYGIYTMQILGLLLLLTNLTYATLVPRGDRRLLIPFEGQSLSFKFGWNFWAVSIGGCLSLFVGTLIVIIDSLFPNFIFTTILDVDFDSHHKYYRHRPKHQQQKRDQSGAITSQAERPERPPFFLDSSTAKSSTSTDTSSSANFKSNKQRDNTNSSLGQLFSSTNNPEEGEEVEGEREEEEDEYDGEISSDSEMTTSSKVSVTRRLQLASTSQTSETLKDHYKSVAEKKANLKRTHHQTASSNNRLQTTNGDNESHLSHL